MQLYLCVAVVLSMFLEKLTLCIVWNLMELDFAYAESG